MKCTVCLKNFSECECEKPDCNSVCDMAYEYLCKVELICAVLRFRDRVSDTKKICIIRTIMSMSIK